MDIVSVIVTIMEKIDFNSWTLDAPTGTLIFGGLDTSKYSGNLQTIPILHDEGATPTELIVALNGFSANYNGASTDFTDDTFPLPVLLDSGTTVTILPDAIFQKIAELTNATDAGMGVLIVSCSSPGSYFSFQFGGPSVSSIRVPWTSIAPPFIQENGTVLMEDGQPICVLLIQSDEGSGTLVLGDSFLRSAYVVFDLGNYEISIAQANVENTANSNVVAIPSAGVGAVVSASTAASITPTISMIASSTRPHSIDSGIESSIQSLTRTSELTTSIKISQSPGTPLMTSTATQSASSASVTHNTVTSPLTGQVSTSATVVQPTGTLITGSSFISASSAYSITSAGYSTPIESTTTTGSSTTTSNNTASSSMTSRLTASKASTSAFSTSINSESTSVKISESTAGGHTTSNMAPQSVASSIMSSNKLSSSTSSQSTNSVVSSSATGMTTTSILGQTPYPSIPPPALSAGNHNRATRSILLYLVPVVLCVLICN